MGCRGWERGFNSNAGRILIAHFDVAHACPVLCEKPMASLTVGIVAQAHPESRARALRDCEDGVVWAAKQCGVFDE